MNAALFDADNNQNRALANVRRHPAEHHHVIVDLQDGVRRCGQCAWEIGRDGICPGCQAVYPDLDMTDEVDDEICHGDSEDMGTNYETEEEDGRSGEDEDGESMVRLASRDSDGSSDVQVVRRVRRVLSESGSDVEVQPNAGARRRAAEEESFRRRPVSISSLSSTPNSDRPEYSRSRDGQLVRRTGLAIARGDGRVPSSSSREGYSSNLSEPGTPMHHDYHDRMADHSGNAHVPESSITAGHSDDKDDEDEDGDDGGNSDHFGHGHASSFGDHSLDGSSSLDRSDHPSYGDEDSTEQDSDSDSDSDIDY